jgi:3-hydroxyisobutyrate dehydrogenase-like beta-hydroxyacid dehydrogenase
MTGNAIRHIAVIGFGEAGGIFARDFAAAGFDVTVCDILLRGESSRGSMLAKARTANVCAWESLKEAARNAQLVISAVTASSAGDVAREAALSLRPGQIFLDINSVSPETKREISKTLEPTRAIFVEAAVMAPVPPLRLKVPMLLAGAEAKTVAERLQEIGMNAMPVSDRIGVASAIKMCRSVMIKGLEALAVESLFAARRYGAETEVLASFAATYPQMGWDTHLPDYLIRRVAEHGRRRASEMREAAETLRSIGIDPWTALATAERQEWLVQQMAERNIPYRVDEPFSWRALADAIAGASSPSAEEVSRKHGDAAK